MPGNFFLKLRSNIELDQDIELAEREAKALFGQVRRVQDYSSPTAEVPVPTTLLTANSRQQAPVGFIASQPKYDLNLIAASPAFIQEIWFLVADRSKTGLKDSPFWEARQVPGGYAICVLPLMAAGELLSCTKNGLPNSQLLHRFTQVLSDTSAVGDGHMLASLTRRGTSNPHVHGLHKYKAKSFPRMVRSLIVSCLETLPKNLDGEITVMDPFVGSGTTLIEASLLGLPSIGIDIDRLSCHISNAKIDLLTGINPQELRDAVSETITRTGELFQTAANHDRYSFPPWITRKFERWHSQIEQVELETEITKWLGAINEVANSAIRRVLEVCLSDAIGRKFNIRMMGTGVGRFALEIAKTRLSTLMESNLNRLLHTAFTCATLISAYDGRLGKAKVLNDTATSMPLPNESVSLILTSPPYLPASSGRENYLISKSVSITALGLMSGKEIQAKEKQSVGSMKSIGTLDWKGVPNEVHRLYEWLKNDSLREIKAVPTVLYYRDIKKALGESFRVLVPGGIAIYIIGKESVFYRFSTRKVLYRVSCDDIFREIAESCGFIVEESIDVELAKKNRNARPRSLDSYYETVVQLRKPVSGRSVK